MKITVEYPDAAIAKTLAEWGQQAIVRASDAERPEYGAGYLAATLAIISDFESMVEAAQVRHMNMVERHASRKD